VTITANEIVSRAASLLFDLEKVRWPEAELLLWVADAQQLIGKNVPDSVSTVMNIPLVAGTKQTLDASFSRLLRIIRNQGSPDAGQAITLTTRKALDAIRPGWHEETGPIVEHYVYEPEIDRRSFWVYPGPESTIMVQAVVALMTPTAVAAGVPLIVPEIWTNALVDWTMFRALSKQADFGSAGPRAEAHARAFAAAIGMEWSARGLVNPNREIRNSGTAI